MGFLQLLCLEKRGEMWGFLKFILAGWDFGVKNAFFSEQTQAGPSPRGAGIQLEILQTSPGSPEPPNSGRKRGDSINSGILIN